MERTIRALFRSKRFMLDKMPCIYALKEGKNLYGLSYFRNMANFVAISSTRTFHQTYISYF